MGKIKFKKIITIILIVIALGGAYYLYNNYYLKKDDSTNQDDNIIEENIIDKEESNENSKKEEELFVVEIKGYVLYPGCYTFKKDTVIVQDVIDIAGGLSKRGDISNINCSEVVTNHSVIYIGSIESKSYVLSKDESVKLININTCTKEDFMSLPGIGDAKAQAIIDYRKENGYFNSIEDIKKVSGIGEALFDRIQSLITV